MRYPEFAKRFIQACKQAGMPKSQDALGKKLGVSGPTIWCYRNGTKLPSTEKAGEIAKILNVSIDWLINGSNTVALTETEFRLLSLYRESSDLAKHMIMGAAEIGATGDLLPQNISRVSEK